MEDGSKGAQLPRWYVKAIWYAIFAVTLSIAGGTSHFNSPT